MHFFTKNPKLEKRIFGGGGGGSDLFYKELK